MIESLRVVVMLEVQNEQSYFNSCCWKIYRTHGTTGLGCQIHSAVFTKVFVIWQGKIGSAVRQHIIGRHIVGIWQSRRSGLQAKGWTES